MEFLNSKLIDEIIDLALKEDIGDGDKSTEAVISLAEKAEAYIMAKADGIISGLPIAERIYRKFDPSLVWNPLKRDGDKISRGDVVVEFSGTLRAVLSGERTALNFLQRMSGISTSASKYAEAVKDLNVKILDTRKTAPGQRMLDKYAVKMGGGTNHRIGLYDMVMIKDNHIKAAGSISAAVEKTRTMFGNRYKIEVETSNIDEVNEALSSKADIIMLDNMTIEKMKKAVEIINRRALVEASGGVNLDKVKAIAETGVDFISVGAITHSVKALDLSQYIK
jgi:nicotinate-nucleotide pyrophosphorylase (carboxylating)